MPFQGRTKVSELKDLITKLGGTPKGNTFAQLQDELEQLVNSGGEAVPSGDITIAEFTEEDIEEVFSDGEGS